MPPIIPKLKARNDNSIILNLPYDTPPPPSQLCLAMYRAHESASEAQGILYEIVKLNPPALKSTASSLSSSSSSSSGQKSMKDAKQTHYATYRRWSGNDDAYFELQNHEDPYGGYLVQKYWEDEDEHKYKALTMDLRTVLWRMRILQPGAEDAIPGTSSSLYQSFRCYETL